MDRSLLIFLLIFPFLLIQVFIFFDPASETLVYFVVSFVLRATPLECVRDGKSPGDKVLFFPSVSILVEKKLMRDTLTAMLRKRKMYSLQA